MILAGDVGGTKTYLGLFAVEGSRLRTVKTDEFRTADFPSLEDLVRRFMAGREPAQVACFGVPGPVIRDRIEATRVEVTNVAWVLDSSELTDDLDTPVYLINDLVAAGTGLDLLSPEEFLVLNEGSSGIFAQGDAADTVFYVSRRAR